MFSFGISFDTEIFDDLNERIKRLRDMYSSLKRDFINDDDDSVPHFNLYLGSEILKTDVGPQLRVALRNKAHVVAVLKERKEKIEKLLAEIDELEIAASKLESEVNQSKSSKCL